MAGTRHPEKVDERLIDLGVVNDHADQLDIGPPPAVAGRRHWPFVMVLALLAAFTGGSGASISVEAVGVLAEHTVGFVADRGALYALREDPAVTAYDWGTGEERWSRSIPSNAGQVYLAADRAYIRHRPCTDATGAPEASHCWLPSAGSSRSRLQPTASVQGRCRMYARSAAR